MVKLGRTRNEIIISSSDYHLNIVLSDERKNSFKDNGCLPESKENDMTEFDRILQKRWQKHMDDGHFRYGLDVLETRNVYRTGRFEYFPRWCGITRKN